MTDLESLVAEAQTIVEEAVARMEREIGRELEDDEYDALVDDVLSELDDDDQPELFRYAKKKWNEKDHPRETAPPEHAGEFATKDAPTATTIGKPFNKYFVGVEADDEQISKKQLDDVKGIFQSCLGSDARVEKEEGTSEGEYCVIAPDVDGREVVAPMWKTKSGHILCENFGFVWKDKPDDYSVEDAPSKDSVGFARKIKNLFLGLANSGIILSFTGADKRRQELYEKMAKKIGLQKTEYTTRTKTAEAGWIKGAQYKHEKIAFWHSPVTEQADLPPDVSEDDRTLLDKASDFVDDLLKFQRSNFDELVRVVDEIQRYANFDPSQSRGQPDNAGKFAEKPGGEDVKEQEHPEQRAPGKYKIKKHRVDQGAINLMAKQFNIKGVETPEQFAQFFGIQPDQDMDAVEVWCEGPLLKTLAFTAAGPWGQAHRSMSKAANGDLVIKNRWIEIKETGTGASTKMLVSQVKNAIDAGVKRIECEAAGSAENEEFLAEYNKKSGRKDKAMIGYRNWPKHGFDGPLDAMNAKHHSSEMQKMMDAMPDMWKDKVQTVLDIYAQPGGEQWWREHGVEFYATFDLTPGSRSRKVLTNYVMKVMDKLYGGEAAPIRFQK